MSGIKDIIRTLANDASVEVYAIIGTITAIDKGQRTVDVKPLNDDAEVFGVRLQSSIEGNNGVVIFPEMDSVVTVVFLNKETGFVAQFSKVESVEIVIEKQSQTYTNKGLSLASDKSDIAKDMEALIDSVDAICKTLNKFQLATNMGPTVSVMPHIVTEISQHQQQLSTIKSNFKSYLNAT